MGRLWESLKGVQMESAGKQVPSSRLAQVFLGVHNDRPPSPEGTGLTRGLVAAALAEVVSLVVYTLPASSDTRAFILSHTGAIVALVSYIAYGYLDGWLKRRGLK